MQEIFLRVDTNIKTVPQYLENVILLMDDLKNSGECRIIIQLKEVKFETISLSH